jgi:hypothetical protein
VLHGEAFAGPAAVVHVQPDQLAQHGQPQDACRVGEEVLQPRDLARLPRLLEAAADFIEPPNRLLRQLVQQR